MNLTFRENKKLFIILLLVIAVMAVAAFLFGRADSGNAPEITSTEGNLKVSVKSKEKVLMKGIIATDKEDGDLTDQLIIESYSDFSSEGIRTVTYAVMDSDLNVSKYERTIEYTDYTAPKFSMKYNLIWSPSDKDEILDNLKAKDVIDGKLTGKIRILSSDVYSGEPGDYTARYAVTNSAGNVSEIEFKVTIDEDIKSGDDCIELSKYIVYINKGESVDWSQYIKSVVSPANGSKMAASSVSIDKHGNMDKAGYAYVDYTIKDGNAKDMTRLTVVVQ